MFTADSYHWVAYCVVFALRIHLGKQLAAVLDKISCRLIKEATAIAIGTLCTVAIRLQHA
jgi:hypothetical protein